MDNMQEIISKLQKVNEDISAFKTSINFDETYSRHTSNPALIKLQVYKRELERDLETIQHPRKEKTPEENLELGRILRKTTHTRTPEEAAFMASMMNR